MPVLITLMVFDPETRVLQSRDLLVRRAEGVTSISLAAW